MFVRLIPYFYPLNFIWQDFCRPNVENHDCLICESSVLAGNTGQSFDCGQTLIDLILNELKLLNGTSIQFSDVTSVVILPAKLNSQHSTLTHWLQLCLKETKSIQTNILSIPDTSTIGKIDSSVFSSIASMSTLGEVDASAISSTAIRSAISQSYCAGIPSEAAIFSLVKSTPLAFH